MKKVQLIIILFSFSLRPMLFVGQMLYYEMNIDYIIKTYCINKEKPELQCNGKCHLAKQLQIATNDDNDNSDTDLIFEAFYPLYFQNITLEISKSNIEIFSVNNWSLEQFIDSNFLENPFQPPELSS